MSKEISTLWKNETDEVKSYYEYLAAKEKQEHTEKYPDYKYEPRTNQYGH